MDRACQIRAEPVVPDGSASHRLPREIFDQIAEEVFENSRERSTATQCKGTLAFMLTCKSFCVAMMQRLHKGATLVLEICSDLETEKTGLRLQYNNNEHDCFLGGRESFRDCCDEFEFPIVESMMFELTPERWYPEVVFSSANQTIYTICQYLQSMTRVCGRRLSVHVSVLDHEYDPKRNWSSWFSMSPRIRRHMRYRRWNTPSGSPVRTLASSDFLDIHYTWNLYFQLAMFKGLGRDMTFHASDRILAEFFEVDGDETLNAAVIEMGCCTTLEFHRDAATKTVTFRCTKPH